MPLEFYKSSNRKHDRISNQLRDELNSIEPSGNKDIRYYPCLVITKDGIEIDKVYFVSAQEYIKFWGVWPEEDPAKKYIDISKVLHIKKSPTRLPVYIANKIYDAGESGMGYHIFTLVFCDGLKQVYQGGDVVDFVPMPEGENIEKIIDVVSHKGREENHILKGDDYFWCLFEE